MALNDPRVDVLIDNEPFAVKSYFRSTTDDQVARFGSSEKGQTNLDLLKAATQKSFRGGMFQRTMLDEEMVSTIRNAYYNKLDDNLYFTPVPTVATFASSMSFLGVQSWAYFKGSLYLAFNSEAPGPIFTRIHKIDLQTRVVTALTLPAGLSNSYDPIKITAYKDWIFIAPKIYPASPADAYRFDGTTFVNVSGGFADFIEFRDKLYGIAHHNSLFLINTYNTATLAYTMIKDIGPTDATYLRAYQGSIKFNGALYIAMSHGLYRYDGVDINPVIDLTKHSDKNNFKHMAIFNGRLYYTIKNKIFEFDGVNINEIQDFTEGYKICGIFGGTDRLWVSARNNTYTVAGDPQYGAGLAANFYNFSMFTYNGVGFFEYRAFNDPFPAANTPVVIDINDEIWWIEPNNYYNASYEDRSNGYKYSIINKNSEFTVTDIGADRYFEVFSSEFDAGYPAVAKTFNGIMADYLGLEDAKSHLKIEISTLYKGVWSSYVEVWNDKNRSATGIADDYQLHDQSTAGAPVLPTMPLIFDRCRFHIVMTIDAGVTLLTPPRIRSLTMRYTIQPRPRRKWLLTLNIFGKDKNGLDDIYNADGSKDTRFASQLRRKLNDAYEKKLPVLFYDVDYSKLTSTSPLKAKGAYWLKTGDYVAIRESDPTKWTNRRITVTSVDTVNDLVWFTLDSMGQRLAIGGSAAGTYAVDSPVRKSYAVYVTRISNEQYIIDDNSANDDDGASDFSSVLTVELVEV